MTNLSLKDSKQIVLNNTKKKKLLILTYDQFGASTTSYKHCEFARETYDITYLGWDYGQPKIDLPNITIKHVSRKSNIIVRNLRLLLAFYKEVRKGYDVVFANYVRGISIIRLLNPRVNFIIYIVTLGVMPSKLKRFIFDYTMKIELMFFKKILLINKGIGKKLGIRKFKVLPLGGDCFSKNKKSFDHLSLLYVGTLSNRNIIQCVEGFHRFVKELAQNGKSEKLKFTIVGDSMFHELKEINKYIADNGLKEKIHTTGYVNRDDLNTYFDEANIGVSYVPVRPYYQYQPPTKTYEYLISGLPVIATATKANEEIMGNDSGTLIPDDPKSFYKALLFIQKNKTTYDSDKIRDQYAECTWERVVKDKFIGFVEESFS